MQLVTQMGQDQDISLSLPSPQCLPFPFPFLFSSPSSSHWVGQVDIATTHPQISPTPNRFSGSPRPSVSKFDDNSDSCHSLSTWQLCPAVCASNPITLHAGQGCYDCYPILQMMERRLREGEPLARGCRASRGQAGISAVLL